MKVYIIEQEIIDGGFRYFRISKVFSERNKAVEYLTTEGFEERPFTGFEKEFGSVRVIAKITEKEVI